MTNSPRLDLTAEMLCALDASLRGVVLRLQTQENGLWQMASYAMGWHPDNPSGGGKRIRPLLALLVAGSLPADWRAALPAACAVELIHAFSLVHDDIQDNSELRRGAPTLWRKFGVAHAINAGDALYTLAFSALADMPAPSPRILEILAGACIRLTQGQYLDMQFERAEQTTLAQYEAMIDGKTAALIETAARLGAISAGASAEREAWFAQFGRGLGLAFQAQDDYLGIWGTATETGKSAASDLLSRKKSLPILHGLQQSPEFGPLLASEPLEPALPKLMALLEQCGAREFTLQQARQWTERAFESLDAASPSGESAAALKALAHSLLGRSR
jgi:geranylgeranyl diphosphate synthase, type I